MHGNNNGDLDESFAPFTATQNGPSYECKATELLETQTGGQSRL